MTAKDCWGYQYFHTKDVYEDHKGKENKVLLQYYYSENDGWAFMRDGPQRQMVIELDKSVTRDDLEAILKRCKINDDAKMLIKRMLKKGDIKSGSYPVD